MSNLGVLIAFFDFFFNDTATTEIYTLSLHDALPIYWQIQEATEFAGRTFKRLMYFTCDHPDKFLPEVTEALTAFENRLTIEQEKVEQIADALFKGGHADFALAYLTDYTSSSAKAALDLGKALLASIEARTRVLYGLRLPEADETSRLDSQMVRCN